MVLICLLPLEQQFITFDHLSCLSVYLYILIYIHLGGELLRISCKQPDYSAASPTRRIFSYVTSIPWSHFKKMNLNCTKSDIQSLFRFPLLPSRKLQGCWRYLGLTDSQDSRASTTPPSVQQRLNATKRPWLPESQSWGPSVPTHASRLVFSVPRSLWAANTLPLCGPAFLQ